MGRHRDRGGWGRDRGRDRRREREEEGVKNHEDQLRKAKEMGGEMPTRLDRLWYSQDNDGRTNQHSDSCANRKSNEEIIEGR